MTFSLILQQPRRLLSLGECHHSVLNDMMSGRIQQALRDGKWTCHVCGVHLPHLMEIDHFDDHRLERHGRIATICQFCHDLKHPIWAASSGRLVPVEMTSEIDQRTLTRLSWIMISRRLHDPHNAKGLESAIRVLWNGPSDRHWDFSGSWLADQLETLLAVSELASVESARMFAQGLDSSMRFLPNALMDDNALRPEANGFVALTERVLLEATRRPFARSEADAIVARFMSLEEVAGADAQDNSDGAAGFDLEAAADRETDAIMANLEAFKEWVHAGAQDNSDSAASCGPDCAVGGDTDPPSAGAANMDATPAPQTEEPGVSEPRCGPQGTLAFASSPNRDSDDEGM